SNKYGSQNSLNDGFKILNKLGKVSGKWTYTLLNSIESESYDPNDLGFLFNPNENVSNISVKYNEYKPKNENLILYNFESAIAYETLWKPGKFNSAYMELNGFIMFKSRFATGYEISINPFTSYDYFESRSKEFNNPLAIPRNYGFSSFISTDYRKRFALDANIFYNKSDQPGRRFTNLSLKPRIRFNDHFTVRVQSSVGDVRNEIGYISRSLFDYQYNDLHEDDIMMGLRNRLVIENIVSSSYIINAYMGLNMRLRHYWTKVVYNDFFILEKLGELNRLNIPIEEKNTIKVFDRKLNLFNIDFEYRWRFRKGSDLIFVWKNEINSSQFDYDKNYSDDLLSIFSKDQNNNLSLKFIYYLDVNDVI
ncbi:MAG: hypothetical protein RLZZ546_679, partial [Bacteroidota bacterium]